jgi:hemerythrin-like domain-containing protein
MSTWNVLTRLHHEIFRKIQLLEEASLDLLAKKIAYEKREKLTEDFVKFFRAGVIQHFKVEEVALFPILRRNSKDAEPIISELISEHKTMINRYLKIQDAKNPGVAKMGDLKTLLEELSEHARKEERSIPPFIEMLNKEQLKKIDELARHLEYSL